MENNEDNFNGNIKEEIRRNGAETQRALKIILMFGLDCAPSSIKEIEEYEECARYGAKIPREKDPIKRSEYQRTFQKKLNTLHSKYHPSNIFSTERLEPQGTAVDSKSSNTINNSTVTTNHNSLPPANNANIPKIPTNERLEKYFSNENAQQIIDSNEVQKELAFVNNTKHH